MNFWQSFPQMLFQCWIILTYIPQFYANILGEGIISRGHFHLVALGDSQVLPELFLYKWFAPT